MANESNKELTSVWTPANIVTCVRIVFIPVFMIVSALSHTSVAGTDWSIFDGPLAAAAFILYVILSCTDKVDGYLARSPTCAAVAAKPSDSARSMASWARSSLTSSST